MIALFLLCGALAAGCGSSIEASIYGSGEAAYQTQAQVFLTQTQQVYDGMATAVGRLASPVPADRQAAHAALSALHDEAQRIGTIAGQLSSIDEERAAIAQAASVAAGVAGKLAQPASDLLSATTLRNVQAALHGFASNIGTVGGQSGTRASNTIELVLHGALRRMLATGGPIGGVAVNAANYSD